MTPRFEQASRYTLRRPEILRRLPDYAILGVTSFVATCVLLCAVSNVRN